MKNVIENNARFSDNIEYKYGVEYFHPVWELLIDNAFLLPSNNTEEFSCDRYATIEELTDYKDKRFGKVFAVYCNVKKIMQYSYKKAPKEDIENLSKLIKNNYLKIVETNGKKINDYSNDEVKKATNIITTEIDKISKKSLAANIDLQIFKPIYEKLNKLFSNDM